MVMKIPYDIEALDPVMVAGSYLVDANPRQVAVVGEGDDRAMHISDIDQQGTPTCSFAAVLGSIAETTYDLAQNIRFVGQTVDDVYEYSVRLFRPMMVNGALKSVGNAFWTRVLYSPTEGHEHAESFGRDLGKGDRDEIWSLLYQRAYLQNFATQDAEGQWLEGDYQNRSFAFASITGRLGKYVDIADAQSRIRTALRNKDVATVASPGNDKKRPVNGIVQNHAYSIVDLTGSGSDAKVTLRNPHGHDNTGEIEIHSEYDGPDADSSDGYITLVWSDFVKEFSQPRSEVFVGTVG